jgi:hypothetical protein
MLVCLLVSLGILCLPCNHRVDMGRLSGVTCCFPSFVDIRGRRTGCDLLN